MVAPLGHLRCSLPFHWQPLLPLSIGLRAILICFGTFFNLYKGLIMDRILAVITFLVSSFFFLRAALAQVDLLFGIKILILLWKCISASSVLACVPLSMSTKIQDYLLGFSSPGGVVSPGHSPLQANATLAIVIIIFIHSIFIYLFPVLLH